MAKNDRITEISTMLSLENEHTLVQTLTDTVPVAITMLDPEGTIRFANRRAEELLGLTRSQLEREKYNAPVFLITAIEGGPFPDDALPFVRVRQTLAPVSDIRHAITRPDGSRVLLSIYAAPLFDREHRFNGVICAIVDITERRAAEEERTRLETQLFQAQKIESIGVLAAGVAHDFNNLLNIIMGNASLISQTPVNLDKLPKRVDAITKATERGAQLVKQLLTFARKTDFEPRTVVLNDLILETTKLFEETFPKTIEIILKLTPGIPDVTGDPNQLYQIIVNLCVNSRDAMAHGGTLTITTEMVAGDALHATYPAAAARLYAKVTITDTGTGMDEETLRRIFDPFFTTKEKGKGTGLGLPVVLGIIESHKGFIETDSAPGCGTEFRIYLPGVEQIVESKEEIARTLESIEGGTETILFVEDEPLTREMITEFLEEKGYAVLTADNGRDAVDIFERHCEEIQLILTDFGLPVFDGEEVVRRIKRTRPDMPVIMISGFVAPERKAVLLELGVTDVLPKPYQLAGLFEKVRTVLDTTQRR